jgi:hypothetical protein
MEAAWVLPWRCWVAHDIEVRMRRDSTYDGNTWISDIGLQISPKKESLFEAIERPICCWQEVMYDSFYRWRRHWGQWLFERKWSLEFEDLSFHLPWILSH